MRIVNRTLQGKSGLDIMSEYVRKIENGVQIWSIRCQNEQLGCV